jgi:transcriptional regulator with XRE-family HTH domain
MAALAQPESHVYGLVLGRIIATLRHRKGLTQAQLADAIGVSQPVMSRIEAGTIQPTAYGFECLATALGLSVQELHHHVADGIARSRDAATAAIKTKKSSSDPWKTAFGVAGVIGLGGLIGFAVAAMLKDDE